jgi:PiT family inorganic phosphate transporter
MKLTTISDFQESASEASGKELYRFGIAIIFMVGVFIWSYLAQGSVPNNTYLAIAALIGAFMAMNIGANDVANNVGPAVGSKALTLGGAIVIAAIFEAGGAIIAGGDVVKTIKKGIIDPSAFADTQTFIWAMTAALLAAAGWLTVSTLRGNPVSTTHSIVGGVAGAGIAAGGFGVVDWGTMGKIVASWVASPVMGGVIAAAFLYLIKRTIIFRKNKVEAARKWVPIFVAIMAWAFGTYLMLKGVKKIIKVDFATAAAIGLAISGVTYAILRPVVARASENMKNNRKAVAGLFTFPLIFAAALLSFAHGANDVANAVGPLAGISDAIMHGEISQKAPIPLWVMIVGALGIALGLALYGPKLIKTVGSEITDLDQVRAFSVALAAAITVIIASQAGVPVSSTHIAIGAIFGVGFLREWLQDKEDTNIIEEKEEAVEEEQKTIQSMHKELEELKKKPDSDRGKADYKKITKLLEEIDAEEERLQADAEVLGEAKREVYVRRDMGKKIAIAWIVTVPSAAVLSAIIFYTLRGALGSH